MYLISKEGSRHLLEFLRNLTPQVLLLSSAVILCFYWFEKQGSLVYLILSVGVVIMCAFATIANANNFIDNAFSHTEAIANERDRLESNSVDGIKRVLGLIRYIWSEKPGTIIEIAIVFLFVYGALTAVVVASISTAIRLWK